MSGILLQTLVIGGLVAVSGINGQFKPKVHDQFLRNPQHLGWVDHSRKDPHWQGGEYGRPYCQDKGALVWCDDIWRNK